MPEQCTILLWFHVHLKQPATISDEPSSMFLYCNYHWLKKKKSLSEARIWGCRMCTICSCLCVCVCLYVCSPCSFLSCPKLNSWIWSLRLFFLLCLCPASSEGSSLTLHPMWHPLTSTLFQEVCPGCKIRAGGIVLCLIQGSPWVWRGDAACLAHQPWPQPAQIFSLFIDGSPSQISVGVRITQVLI